VGWLVVEDLFTVIALVVLPLLFAREGASRGLGMALLLTGVKVAALVAFTALVGTHIIPRVLDHVARTHSRELFTLTVLVIALGIAVGSAVVFDVSMALGAFLAGLVIPTDTKNSTANASRNSARLPTRSITSANA
jgi:CPA2 family monovalent cation:H+ antiporter-2